MRGEIDVGIGSRFLAKTGFKSSLSRRIGILIFRGALYLATGKLITDNTSGFRAFNREAIIYLADNYPTDYPEVEVIVTLHKLGLCMKEYSVEMDERQGGASSITPVRSVYYMIKVMLAVIVISLRSPVKKLEKLQEADA